jgi:hypothetical protein
LPVLGAWHAVRCAVVDRWWDGQPVEPLSAGAPARDSYIYARDLAATIEGLYVLTFSNEVWWIGADEELELVLQPIVSSPRHPRIEDLNAHIEGLAMDGGGELMAEA